MMHDSPLASTFIISGPNKHYRRALILPASHPRVRSHHKIQALTWQSLDLNPNSGVLRSRPQDTGGADPPLYLEFTPTRKRVPTPTVLEPICGAVVFKSQSVGPRFRNGRQQILPRDNRAVDRPTKCLATLDQVASEETGGPCECLPL